MNAWDALETSLHPAPLFYVEAPDGRRSVTELMRVVQFRRMMRTLAPAALVFPNANAGKRSPRQASAEGIMAGVFDYTVLWDANRGAAWPEFKGYTAAGRAGSLSDAQIEWGNRAYLLGHYVACFFRPESAVEWLRGLGCPIAGRIAA